MIYEHQTLDQSDDADMMNHSFLESNNYHFGFYRFLSRNTKKNLLFRTGL